MKAVVTGGRGFLGSAVVQSLEALGVSPIALGRRDGDLKELTVAARLLGDADLVIHLAATVGGVGFLKDNKTAAYYDNLTIGCNVIQACLNGRASRLVIIGTPCSYPPEAALPLVEEAIATGLAAGDTGPYGLAKASVSRLASHLLLPSGKDVVTLVPANLYGPGDNFDPACSHVVGSLVRRAVVSARTGSGCLEVWGDGTATRDFLHVRDAACAIAAASLSPDPFGGDVFNLASGRETSIRELGEAIAAAADPQMKIQFDPKKPCGVRRRVMSIAKAAIRLNFRPRTAFSDGIRETIAWVNETELWKSWLDPSSRRAA